MRAGDFNGDGIVDIAAANANSNTITIAMGDGAGNFDLAETLNLRGDRPEALIAADLNNDGIDDVASANRDSRDVEVYLATSGGQFSEPESFPVRISARNMESVDINADGNIDLLMGGGVYAGQVLLNNGDGTFTRNISLEAGNQESSLAVGNFDADPQLEVASTLFFDSRVAILEIANIWE